MVCKPLILSCTPQLTRGSICTSITGSSYATTIMSHFKGTIIIDLPRVLSIKIAAPRDDQWGNSLRALFTYIQLVKTPDLYTSITSHQSTKLGSSES